MASYFLILGLLSIVVIIGSFAGFLSIFSKKSNNDDSRHKTLTRQEYDYLIRLGAELSTLKKRLETLEQSQIVSVAQVSEIRTPSPPKVEQAEVIHAQFSEEISALDDDETIAETAAIAAAIKHEPTFHPYQPSSDTAVDQPFNRLFHFAKNWLLGGNTLVRSGIIILFIGISFLLKYATEHTHVPIELRLAGVALLGSGLIYLGWRLRTSRSEYAWALQGGGIGILYLTIFAAFKLYQLLSSGFAFTLLAVVAFLSALIAILQSALSLAVLGFTGGFLAPIFTSTGQGSHVGLFSYYLVLNLAIAFIAYYKSWRPLNILGFAFTFIIGSLWGANSYQPAYFVSTEPFLVLHFLLFTLIAVLYAHRQAPKADDYVDATLVFGTPLVGFSLQYALLRDSPFGLAYSALALGVFYLVLAAWLLNKKRNTVEFLGECFLALGIGFATLTLPLALDGRWTSAAWAVEGVGLVWVGLRQKRQFPLFAGLLLQLLGAGAFVNGWGLTGYSMVTHQNMFLGVAFIALSGWACGALLNAYRAQEEKTLIVLLAVWGWFWWVGAGLTAIDEFLPPVAFNHFALLFVTLTSAVLPSIAGKLKWQHLADLAQALLSVMVIVLLLDLASSHPFAHYGAISWVLAFVVYSRLLLTGQVAKSSWLRTPILWLIAIIGSLEWRYGLVNFVDEATVWRDIGWAVGPICVGAICMYWPRLKVLPKDLRQQDAYTWLWLGCGPLMAFLTLWFLYASLNYSGDAAPLPYVPLFNPLDIALAAILLVLVFWRRKVSVFSDGLQHYSPIAFGLMGFALLNGMLLRTLHYWVGTPFRWSAIFSYPQVQLGFTFLWGISAFLLMLLAHKKVQRQIWLLGAGLMGLVVGKIFLLDLSQHGSIERIISFIGAGILLLIMGYFAPLPPAAPKSNQETS